MKPQDDVKPDEGQSASTGGLGLPSPAKLVGRGDMTFDGYYSAEQMLAYANKARYEAVGWCHAFCCASLDDGIDPRGIEVPDILEKAQQQLEPNNQGNRLAEGESSG